MLKDMLICWHRSTRLGPKSFHKNFYQLIQAKSFQLSATTFNPQKRSHCRTVFLPSREAHTRLLQMLAEQSSPNGLARNTSPAEPNGTSNVNANRMDRMTVVCTQCRAAIPIDETCKIVQRRMSAESRLRIHSTIRISHVQSIQHPRCTSSSAIMMRHPRKQEAYHLVAATVAYVDATCQRRQE